jgi:positive phototaxis protein PixI
MESDLGLVSLNMTYLADSTASDKNAEQFLRLHLVPDTTAILPVSQIAEVLKIPRDRIIAIPHMPPCVIGAYNWRGEILWIVDLGDLLGLTPWYQQEMTEAAYTAIVLTDRIDKSRSSQDRQAAKVLGLVVKRVEDIEWCNQDLIQSPHPSAITSQLAPFLRGYWIKADGEMLVVLEGQAIIDNQWQ